jgi:hypothetical protein
MKRKIQNSGYGIKLDNPSLIETKTSLVMQFLFYFLFLILGVFGVYGCFYTTFSLPLMQKEFISYAVVFCAVFTILFLVKISRILLLVISLSAAAYFLFIKQIIRVLINQLTQGYFITYNSVISAYANKIQSNLFTFPAVPASTTEITAYSTMFAIFTLFFFTLLMAWILIRRKNTFLCFTLTAPFLGVSVVFGIIPHYAAVGAIYVFWAFLILNSTFLRKKSKFNKKKGVFYSGGENEANPQTLILLPILIACLMLVTVIFPINKFKRSDFVKDLRISILNVPKIPSPIQIPIQSILGYTGRVNLQLVGNIKFTGNTVLRVRSSNSEGDYLKGYVGSIYTGQSWDSLPENEYEKLDSILNSLKVQNFSSLFNKLLGRTVKTYDLKIQNVKRNSLRVYAPYGLMSKPEELPGIDFINDGFLRSGNAIFGINEYSMKATTLQIDAWKMSESMINAFNQEQRPFIRAAMEYKNFVYSHYTQVPEKLEERLDQYLYEHNLSMKNFVNPNAFANAIITQVQSENSYTLSPGMTPEGQDFVEYFLFENHKGYCVHFASATVALLRAAGVPARYVEGYAVSPVDFEEYDKWVNIPDSRSHAWVEIYLSAVGWVPVEATPGAARGIIDHETAEAESASASNPLEDEVINDKFYNHELQTEELSDDQGSESSSAEIQNSYDSYLIDTIIRILPTLAMFCSFITVLLSSRKLQIDWRKRHFTQKDRNKAAIAVYVYIVKLYAYAKINETSDCRIPKDLYNLVLKARFSQHLITEQELGNLLVYAENQALEIQETLSFLKRFIGKYIYVIF